MLLGVCAIVAGIPGHGDITRADTSALVMLFRIMGRSETDYCLDVGGTELIDCKFDEKFCGG